MGPADAASTPRDGAPPGREVFRVEALRELAAPERLDEPIRIPRYGVGGAIAAAAGAVRRPRALRVGLAERRRARRARERTPTLLQLQEVDCAAAVLGIVLAHHGRIVPLRRLREDCGISRDGGRAVHLVAAAKGHGMEVKALRRSLTALRSMPLPCIVHWEFNHYLVVEGFGDGHVRVNDPATGHRTIGDEAFSRGYTGIAFSLVPGPAFVREGEPPSRRRMVAQRLAGVRPLLAIAVVLGLLMALPAIATQVLVGAYVNGFVFSEDPAAAGAIAWLMVGLGVLGVVATWSQAEVLRRAWRSVAGREGRRYMDHALRLPMRFMVVRYPGDIAGRAQLTDQVARLLGPSLTNAVVDVVAIGAFVVVAALYDPLLAAIGVVIGIVDVIALRAVLRVQREAALRQGREQARLMAATIHAITSIETVKATGSEDESFARWAGLQARFLNAQAEAARPMRALLAIPPLLATLTTIAVLSVGGLRVIDGTLTIGALVAVQALLAAAAAPRATIAGLGGAVHELDGLVAQLDDVLDEPVARPVPTRTPGPVRPPTATPAPGAARPSDVGSPGSRLAGALELRGLTFGYAPLDPPLIADLDLDLRAGSRVALVGPTGSGKTTLARLITGLHDPWRGEVRIDGRPRGAWAAGLLTDQVAAVDQDALVFSGTIRDNLTLWDPSVSDEALRAAARDACLLGVVEDRALGFDARIEEGGRNLSGGERQRLALARALVRDPALLVLDEATSHLDPPTELEVLENLRRRGATCLIVAHRISAIRDCDEIVVLERGAIVERGDHATLLAAGGAYARLLAAETGP
jgi:NHLM bacteriocin system ABC transporter peptidase/ATP-binding protein